MLKTFSPLSTGFPLHPICLARRKASARNLSVPYSTGFPLHHGWTFVRLEFGEDFQPPTQRGFLCTNTHTCSSGRLNSSFSPLLNGVSSAPIQASKFSSLVANFQPPTQRGLLCTASARTIPTWSWRPFSPLLNGVSSAPPSRGPISVRRASSFSPLLNGDSSASSIRDSCELHVRDVERNKCPSIWPRLNFANIFSSGMAYEKSSGIINPNV